MKAEDNKESKFDKFYKTISTVVILCLAVFAIIQLYKIYKLYTGGEESVNLSNELRYELNADGNSYSVVFADSVSVNMHRFKGIVDILGEYNGKPVTGIQDHAFWGCSGLTNIMIPDSVRSIGNSAFEGCSGLTSITIPDSVTSIGNQAFKDCSGLKSIIIPNNVTSIGGAAFKDCSELKSVIWNARYCEKAGSNYRNLIFDGCYRLTEVTIGEKVRMIPGLAFRGCCGLTSIAIPDSVTSIGDCAFYGCSGLVSVTIGKSVNEISGFAFERCYKLVEIINNSNLNIEKGSVKNGNIGEYALNVKNSEVTGIINRNDYLFYTHDEVNYLLGYVGSSTELILPNDYNAQSYNIYEYAFYDSGNKFTSVTISDGVTSIGYSSFLNCLNLTSVIIGKNVSSICKDVFSGCTSLNNVEFRDTSTWYKTASSNSMENKRNGVLVDVSDSVYNAKIASDYSDYYWYKI